MASVHPDEFTIREWEFADDDFTMLVAVHCKLFEIRVAPRNFLSSPKQTRKFYSILKKEKNGEEYYDWIAECFLPQFKELAPPSQRTEPSTIADCLARPRFDFKCKLKVVNEKHVESPVIPRGQHFDDGEESPYHDSDSDDEEYDDEEPDGHHGHEDLSLPEDKREEEILASLHRSFPHYEPHHVRLLLRDEIETEFGPDHCPMPRKASVRGRTCYFKFVYDREPALAEMESNDPHSFPFEMILG
jgi:hypothetical protein